MGHIHNITNIYNVTGKATPEPHLTTGGEEVTLVAELALVLVVRLVLIIIRDKRGRDGEPPEVSHIH